MQGLTSENSQHSAATYGSPFCFKSGNWLSYPENNPLHAQRAANHSDGLCLVCGQVPRRRGDEPRSGMELSPVVTRGRSRHRAPSGARGLKHRCYLYSACLVFVAPPRGRDERFNHKPSQREIYDMRNYTRKTRNSVTRIRTIPGISVKQLFR